MFIQYKGVKDLLIRKTKRVSGESTWVVTALDNGAKPSESLGMVYARQTFSNKSKLASCLLKVAKSKSKKKKKKKTMIRRTAYREVQRYNITKLPTYCTAYGLATVWECGKLL